MGRRGEGERGEGERGRGGEGERGRGGEGRKGESRTGGEGERGRGGKVIELKSMLPCISNQWHAQQEVNIYEILFSLVFYYYCYYYHPASSSLSIGSSLDSKINFLLCINYTSTVPNIQSTVPNMKNMKCCSIQKLEKGELTG